MPAPSPTSSGPAPLGQGEKSNAATSEPALLLGPGSDLRRLLPICPTSTTVTAFSQALGGSVVISVGCRRWACPFCGRRRVAALSKRVEAAEPKRLMTLTVDPACWNDPRHAYDGTRRALGPFTRAMRREGEFEYFRVLELTKKGWPHYHLMVRSGYRHYAEVRKVWQQLTGAIIVDVRQIKERDNVYFYLMKYLAKQSYCDFTDRRTSQTSKFFPPKTPYPGLELVGHERSMETVHSWLWNKNRPIGLRPIGAYMWAIVPASEAVAPTLWDQEGATEVAPS